MTVDPLDQLLDGLDLQTDLEDIALDREALRLLAALSRLVRREGERTMASLDNLTAAITELGTDVEKAAADVTAALDALKAQIAELSVGAITQDQIDALTASVTTADAAVDALDASVAPPAAPEEPGA
jgi:DNA-binding FadR family transcriptional regulator